MKLLAIETATEACSVALYIDGEVREDFRLAPREHARLVLGMADRLLAEAGLGLGALDALAFGRGPGAFTGVRIATGVVQGMAFARELPVVPVSTLVSLAQGGLRAFGWRRVAAAIDARMQEVYWVACEAVDGVMRPLEEERVCPPSEVSLPQGEGWCGIGSGWQSYAEALAQRLGDACPAQIRGEFFPHAQDVAQLAAEAVAAGLAVSPEQALPVYLRDQVVQRKSS